MRQWLQAQVAVPVAAPMVMAVQFEQGAKEAVSQELQELGRASAKLAEVGLSKIP